MFSALITPSVAKTVNGTAKTPIVSNWPGRRHATQIVQHNAGTKDHQQSRDDLRNKARQRRQIKKIVDDADRDQQKATAEEAEDFTQWQRHAVRPRSAERP